MSSHAKGDGRDDDKDHRRTTSKANPTLAMNEAEPSAVAAMMAVTASPLRSMQHRDSFGNPIAEPDVSNPTRNRWERPLDTIRSFEAAIDGGYNRRSIIRQEADPVANWNRRSTFNPQPAPQPRYPPESFYGGGGSSRPVSHHYPAPAPGLAGPGSSRDSYRGDHGGGYNNSHYGGYVPQPPRHRAPSRMHSEPQYQSYSRDPRDQPPYNLPHKDRSYETVTSAVESGGSDQVGYHTDPTSSDNSSIDRPYPARKPEPINDYGIGFNRSQSSAPNFSIGLPASTNHPLPPPPQEYGSEFSQQAQRRQPTVLRRVPVPSSAPGPAKIEATDKTEKRKSWFSRRFSKRG